MVDHNTEQNLKLTEALELRILYNKIINLKYRETEYTVANATMCQLSDETYNRILGKILIKSKRCKNDHLCKSNDVKNSQLYTS